MDTNILSSQYNIIDDIWDWIDQNLFDPFIDFLDENVFDYNESGPFDPEYYTIDPGIQQGPGAEDFDDPRYNDYWNIDPGIMIEVGPHTPFQPLPDPWA